MVYKIDLPENTPFQMRSIGNEFIKGIDIPKDRDTYGNLWLVTDKDGASKLIMCKEKPIKVENKVWIGGNRLYLAAFVDHPYMCQFFGMFWKEASKEIRKLGLPKWEDDPIEIEVSKIRIIKYA